MMAPSLATLGVTVLSYAASVITAHRTYQLYDSYNYTNFFDRFHFFESNYNTSNYNDVDPTSGYVNYRNRADAEKLGLIAYQGTEMYLGVNHYDNFTIKGRDSVRIESIDTYTHGLFIGDFAHFPAAVCGVWPAFWTYADPWPTKGEIDIYEGWDLPSANRITAHVDAPSAVGNCTLRQKEMTGKVLTNNCWTYDSDPPKEYPGDGCSVQENNGQFGSPSGGIYAMEWTGGHIYIWSWSHDWAPLDISLGIPDPSTWGKPHFAVTQPYCDINRVFSDHKIVLNIDFCGVAAGDNQTWTGECRAKTNANTCKDYVASNPDAFEDVYYKVRSIDIYKLEDEWGQLGDYEE